MYAKSKNYVTYFTDTQAEHTPKLFYGRVSEAIKTGEDGGKNTYEFESYNARFVGKAREKAEKLENKANIMLTEWSIRCPYSKEHKRPYPYMMIMDFETTAEKKK
jgi:hypothetical protein